MPPASAMNVQVEKFAHFNTWVTAMSAAVSARVIKIWGARYEHDKLISAS